LLVVKFFMQQNTKSLISRDEDTNVCVVNSSDCVGGVATAVGMLVVSGL